MILIVTKQSKYEWEQQKFGLSHDELVGKYNKERANLNSILLSHEKQLKVREKVVSVMPDAITCTMSDAPNYLSDQKIKEHDWDLIIVLGGDNSMTFVSQWAADIPVLGVNSDPGGSVGCLTRWSIHDDQSVYDMANMLDQKKFDIHQWPRLVAMIDGKYITSASNEYYFGEKQACKMSRHVMVYEGKEYEQKSSGIVVSTGCGSTGWYSSVLGKAAAFDPTLDIGAFAVREPYEPNDNGCYSGGINSDKELVIYSLNDDQGIVSVDSWEEFNFSRGSEARINIGCPINVVIPKI